MGPKKKAKKKKVKKKKVSEDELLSKAADEYMQQIETHRLLIDRMNRWLDIHYHHVLDTFEKYVKKYESHLISYKEFYSGLRSINIPCSNVELVVLAKTIDVKNEGKIDYTDLSQGFCYTHPVLTIDESQPVLKNKVHETFVKCELCALQKLMSRKDAQIRFIDLTVRLDLGLSAKITTSHPPRETVAKNEKNMSLQLFNFTELVHSHTTIGAIIQRIRHVYTHAVKDIQIFRMVKRSKEILDAVMTLESYGYVGTLSEEEPEHVLLLYEVLDETIDCPILKCDQYFNKTAPNKEKV